MDDVTGILKTLLSLTALVDPLGAIPVFLTVTAHQSAQKQRLTARRAALWAFLILLISAAAGKYVLEVFGVSVASMRVAGGILFLFMGKMTPIKMMSLMCLDNSKPGPIFSCEIPSLARRIFPNMTTNFSDLKAG